ncbi:unnamed protein product [Symbiodinium natans]|uniref:Right handed beta helix domain-containing protein n=1 Tax=Symbiodinium natans TaxID=878477 RepID=A0A812TD34_9DINO|nr:unnamed protein product [Symbiodinium natans]
MTAIAIMVLGLAGLVAKSDGRVHGPQLDPETDLDCGARQLAYLYAQRLQPWLAPHREVFDALQLHTVCGQVPPERGSGGEQQRDPEPASSNTRLGIFVSPAGDDKGGTGSEARPFASLHRALQVRRSHPEARKIILRGGVHFLGLNGTVHLGPGDSELEISSYPGEEAWLSGGIPLKDVAWQKVTHPSTGRSVWRTKMPMGHQSHQIRSLFTLESHARLNWARYPNMNVETDAWGYGSPGRDERYLTLDHVVEWTKPPAGHPTTSTVIDLTDPSNPTGHVKNDSSMTAYNAFNVGSGGVCDSVWDGPSYWCGNSSAGGWAEVDTAAAKAGKLNIPRGMKWNSSLTRLSKWSDPRGAWIHAWHSQTWAVHMFEVSSFDPTSNVMGFSPGGGSQGGRNWCRCDECPYAGGLWTSSGNWCDRKEAAHQNTRIIGGNWIAQGIFEELDEPGEFWYNASSANLWVWPNTTDPNPPRDLVVPVLETLVAVQGAKNVAFRNVGFRDAASTIYRRWGVPSGGDWALHRSAALFLEGTENTSVSNCTFRRLDGNAVLLAGYNRGCLISKSRFQWIGQNAAGAWGDTKNGWDGTTGTQPRGTVVEDSIFHDVGLYQKQSSAWFQAKTAQTTLRGNIMFNLPRAAINFNDGFGGANIVANNLMFNTCRESGDHGPINTWDRMPFLTDIRSGMQNPSFQPALNEVRDNFIFANYGASQGIDNDDGSSFWWIHDNVFYDADGFKMDYGGHGSTFESNLVFSKRGGGQCIGTGDFLKGLGDIFRNNTCWIRGPGKKDDVVGSTSCDPAVMNLDDNIFGTTMGTARMSCGSRHIAIKELVKATGVGKGSVAQKLPSAEHLLEQLAVWLRLPVPPSRARAEGQAALYV